MYFIINRKNRQELVRYVFALAIFFLILTPMILYQTSIYGDDRMFTRAAIGMEHLKTDCSVCGSDNISGMPFMGPVGASRVGFIEGKYVLNPSKKELENSKLDLVVAGTKDAVLMVESEANGLTEEEMLNAVKFGHENFVPVIEMTRLSLLRSKNRSSSVIIIFKFFLK